MSNKILDLNTFVQDTLEVKLLDGNSIKLTKPTKKIALQMMALQNIDTSNPDMALSAITEMVAIIFNNNQQGKKFATKWIEDNLDYSLLMAIVQEYSNWINELVSKPF